MNMNESDPRSDVHYLGSSENKAWKKFQACTGFEPMTSAILPASWSIQDQTWLRSCGHSVVCNDWSNWDIVGDSNNITRVTLIILFLFSSNSSESREDQRSLYFISDVLFLKYHTRNICSISNAWKDQYNNTYHDNGFNENESKWRDCNN